MTAIDPFASIRLGAQPNPTTTTQQTHDNQFGQDTFLKLLVAQLRYQNPMDPQDGTQFLTQTAQFTMVEKLNSLASQSQVLTAATMIGKQVSYKDTHGGEHTGVVAGVKVGADGATLKVNRAASDPLGAGTDSIPFTSIDELDPPDPSSSSSSSST
jgi:flagellar basal-body rod modification protein FlgD